MYLAIIIVFILGYLAIALEHNININKTATALLLGVVCWTLLVFGSDTIFPNLESMESLHFLSESLLEQVGEISEILFFLLGAMTIVELMDAHEGFGLITDKIKIKKKSHLLIILSFITFFLSAALDNLTTAIVMAAVLRKMIKDKNDLWIFASMMIIAANAGGAWSPIGDVTTIMLWIGGQITASNIIAEIFIPSLVSTLIPLVILSIKLKGDVEIINENAELLRKRNEVSTFEKTIVFATGISALLFVPIFKTITHLPPFMGILFGLSIMWILTEVLHMKKSEAHKKSLSITGILTRIDTPSILFFLGILLAVAALQVGGHLLQLSQVLDANFDSVYMVNGLIGILSSVIDNVPMVAGAMGMYTLEVYPVDSAFWELLAYCAGTGGSILIIGSAAGVAIMGIFKIDFIWYIKKISFVAILGYLSGIFTYMLLN
ncbi:sodium:proton antiporter NhaD [Confluentibacter sediminis]|uniref:sodium:proton antiporter NhaD n=1 Tax=Confluentibacter sediminis TaxID=2219045 RepID=UPI000DABC756|nr:sodium:proton antiporter NhaD [Confluentibacter sediminis]